MRGRLLTETLDDGYGGRQVSAYVPPTPAEAVVYAGDGQLIAPWGVDLESTTLPPTTVVGVHRVDDEALRIQEYALGTSTHAFTFDHERFYAHERFVVETVRGWAADRLGIDLPAASTAALGVSASAELALALGVRHPDVFGTVLAASPGAGYRPPADLPKPTPRVYLVAGDQEPFFAENATRWAEALSAARAEVVLVERHGAHGGPFWRAELPCMLAWAFTR